MSYIPAPEHQLAWQSPQQQHQHQHQQPLQPTPPRVAVPQYNEYGTICNLFNPYKRDPKTMAAFHKVPIQHHQHFQHQQQQPQPPPYHQTHPPQTASFASAAPARIRL